MYPPGACAEHRTVSLPVLRGDCGARGAEELQSGDGMKLQLANSLRTGLVLLAAGSVYAQQPLVATGNPDLEGQVAPAVDSSSPPAAEPATAAASKPEPTLPPKHKIGPLEISVNWRTRAG